LFTEGFHQGLRKEWIPLEQFSVLSARWLSTATPWLQSFR